MRHDIGDEDKFLVQLVAAVFAVPLKAVELIGGAYEAAELDAKAAIKQASYLAAAA